MSLEELERCASAWRTDDPRVGQVCFFQMVAHCAFVMIKTIVAFACVLAWVLTA